MSNHKIDARDILDIRETDAFFRGLSVSAWLFGIILVLMTLLYIIEEGQIPDWFWRVATQIAAYAITTAIIFSIAFRIVFKKLSKETQHKIDQIMENTNPHG